MSEKQLRLGQTLLMWPHKKSAMQRPGVHDVRTFARHYRLNHHDQELSRFSRATMQLTASSSAETTLRRRLGPTAPYSGRSVPGRALHPKNASATRPWVYKYALCAETVNDKLENTLNGLTHYPANEYWLMRKYLVRVFAQKGGGMSLPDLNNQSRNVRILPGVGPQVCYRLMSKNRSF